MSQTFQFTIPLPPPEASPNGRFHWAQKNRAINGTGKRSGYKQTVFCYAWRARPMDWAPKPIRISFEWFMGPSKVSRHYRPTDEDNAAASLKSAIDAIKTARWVPDDTSDWVKTGETNLHRTKAEHNGRCEILVTIEVIE